MTLFSMAKRGYDPRSMDLGSYPGVVKMTLFSMAKRGYDPRSMDLGSYPAVPAVYRYIGPVHPVYQLVYGIWAWGHGIVGYIGNVAYYSMTVPKHRCSHCGESTAIVS